MSNNSFRNIAATLSGVSVVEAVAPVPALFKLLPLDFVIGLLISSLD